MTSRAFAYVRLSQDDLRGPGATEEKFAVRVTICRDLAARHQLELPDDHIVIERVTATRLAKCTGLLRLLDLARRGQIDYLLSPSQDRILRGDKRDEQDIEDALVLGGVTLLTTEQTTNFGSETYDTTDALLFDVKAAVGRHYVRDLIYKRKKADRVKLAENKRTRGFAPYGFRYRRALRDAYGALISPPGYDVLEGEFAIAQEIFQRIRRESLRAICNDLNARKIPAPGVGRTLAASDRWRAQTLRQILLNPFYAGYHAQRVRIGRGGRAIYLAPDDYVLAETPGDWPTILTLDAWREVNQFLAARVTGPRGRFGLLTSLLYGPCGRRLALCGNGRDYRCHCMVEGVEHRGRTVGGVRLEKWAVSVVEAVIEALPPDALTRRERACPQPRPDYASQQRVVQDASRKVQKLIEDRAFLISQFGMEGFQAAAAAANAELARAKAALEEADAARAEPSAGELRSLVERVRAVGLRQLWAEADPEKRRELLRAFIRRIDLDPIPEGNRTYQSARVTLRDRFARFAEVIPALPPARKK